MKICSKVKDILAKDTYIEILTDAAPIRIYFLTDLILRIRAGFDGDFEESSYSLMLTGWEDRMDFLYEGKRTRITPVLPTITDQGERILLAGKELDIEITKAPLAISIYDKERTLLHADTPKMAYKEDQNHRRIHTCAIAPGDHFYGFGEKTGDFDKREQFMSMSQSDSLGYNPKETDGLYKHIPFYIKLNEHTKKAVGYFYHNTYQCDFNMGRTISNYWGAHSTYRTDGGDIDLFFIAGPKVSDVVSRYTLLTGTSALLPKQALGYLGSSMYYAELPKDSDDAIIDFIDIAKEEEIPISGFQLSSGYTTQDTPAGQKRCVFTWNTKRFKDPKHFFTEMEKRGVVVSPNVKPGILLTHPDLESFTKENILVKSSTSDEPCVGNWWGGEGVFVDFTSPKAREYWKAKLKENVLDYGTTSVWNDNCEYDSIVDLDARCDFDGKGGTIGQLKPIMANLMCHITEEAIAETTPDKRPFIVCRAGHAGIQAYAQTWSGDNNTSWDTLKYNIPTMLGMGLCGVANYGSDIGGFFGNSPEPELFVRWVQNGVFHPRFSIHSVNADITVTEPWMYPEHTGLIRDAIQLRYRLMPYLYSLMYRANQKGLPILSPLLLDFQEDTNCYDKADSFMIGDLLVATVLEKGAKTRCIYLPAGCDFYDFFTREHYTGGAEISVPVDLSTIPLYLRSGAIVPMTKSIQHNMTTDLCEDLHIVFVADQNASFTLYEDDGCTTAYQKGAYKKTQISMNVEKNITIQFSSEGSYVSSVKEMLLDVVYQQNAPLAVLLGQEVLPQYLYKKKFDAATVGWYYNLSTKSIEIKYPNPNADYTVTILTNALDLIGM